MAELLELLEAEADSDRFFESFLTRVKNLFRASAAGIWLRGAGGQFQLRYQREVDLASFGAFEHGRASHLLLLEDVSLRSRGLWAAPRIPNEADQRPTKANLTPWFLALAPILIDRKAVGVLEVCFSPDEAERLDRAWATRTLADLAGFAAAALHKTEWRKLHDEHQLVQELDACAAEIHGSLNVDEVAHHAVAHAVRVLGGDQASLGIRRGRNCRATAISNSVTIDPRSPLVRAMERLMAASADFAEAWSYQGAPPEGVSPEITRRLDDYLKHSKCRRLWALPLRADEQDTTDVAGVILLEDFTGQGNLNEVMPRWRRMKRHIVPAIRNARAVAKIPLRNLGSWIAFGESDDSFISRYSGFFAAALVAATLFALRVIPLPLRLEAEGELSPSEKRIVFANVAGKVSDFSVRTGDFVEKGQDLVFIDNVEGQGKLDQLNVKVHSLNQRLTFLDDQLARSTSTKEQGDALAERIKSLYELQKAKAERSLLLSQHPNPRKAAIIAPISGQVLSFDAVESLNGKIVKRGEPLLKLAATNGSWEIDLFIPEREIHQVRASLRNTSNKTLDVEMVVSNDPIRIYKASLMADHLAGETTQRDGAVVLPARIPVTDRELLDQRSSLPAGVKIRARILCGTAPAGSVWFGEIWNYVYERFVF